MALITKATVSQFVAKSLEARRRNALARKQAKAAAILHSNTRDIERIEEQLAAIHEVIMTEIGMGQLPNGTKRSPSRLQEWLKAERMILDMLNRARDEPEPSRAGNGHRLIVPVKREAGLVLEPKPSPTLPQLVQVPVPIQVPMPSVDMADLL